MIEFTASSRYKVGTRRLRKHIETSSTNFGIDADRVITIAFVGKRKMRSIARTYKNEDVALPVLSFLHERPGDEFQLNQEKLFGEIVICFPQAVLLAAERNKTVDTMMLELIDHALNNLVTEYKKLIPVKSSSENR